MVEGLIQLVILEKVVEWLTNHGSNSWWWAPECRVMIDGSQIYFSIAEGERTA